jgi:hypothetical protein
MRFLAGFGGGCRARDIGDRSDVIPIDPVPDAQDERRRQERGDSSGRRDGWQETIEVKHSEGLLRAWRSAARNYCSSMQQQRAAIHVVGFAP